MALGPMGQRGARPTLTVWLIDGRWADDRSLVTGVFSSGQLIDVDRPYESGFYEPRICQAHAVAALQRHFFEALRNGQARSPTPSNHLSMHSKESMHASSCIFMHLHVFIFLRYAKFWRRNHSNLACPAWPGCQWGCRRGTAATFSGVP